MELKNIFIINPAAGTKKSKQMAKLLQKKIKTFENIEIYSTKAPGDATDYVRRVCGSTDESVRLFACGGDGTLNEVINGAAEFSNASVGCYPCGSGNDFIKCFGSVEDFLDIEDIFFGVEQELDLIRVNDRYSLNVCNFGLDAGVLVAMHSVRERFGIRGKLAYLAGVVSATVKNMKTPCRITVDGQVVADGNILLCAIANGQYYGSIFRCAPRAQLDDGQLDFCMLRPVPRIKFVTLMGDYIKGTHVDSPKFADILDYRRCKKVTVESLDGKLDYALDGELSRQSVFTAEIVEKAIKFIIPGKLANNLHKSETGELCKQA